MRLYLSLGLLTALNLLITGLAQWYVLVSLGAGPELDALLAAMALPQIVMGLAAGPLASVLVPLLSAEDPGRRRRDAWGFLWLAALSSGALALALAATAPLWIRALAPGFAPATQALATQLARIQQLVLFAGGLSSVVWAQCQAQRSFLWAEAAGGIGAAVSLALLTLGLPAFGVEAAAWAMIARPAITALLLVSKLGRPSGLPRPFQAGSEAWRRLRPLLVGTAYAKMDPFVDRLLLSLAPPGGLSLFYTGQQALALAGAIVDKTFAVPLVPLLADRARHGEWDEFRALYRRRLAVVALLTGGGYVAFALLGRPVLGLLLERGSVTSQDVSTLWTLMLCLGGVLCGGSMGQVLASSFYASGVTSTPTIIGMLGFTLGVAFKIAGFRAFGLYGIAAGATAYYLLNVLMLWVFLERQLSRARMPLRES